MLVPTPTVLNFSFRKSLKGCLKNVICGDRDLLLVLISHHRVAVCVCALFSELECNKSADGLGESEEDGVNEELSWKPCRKMEKTLQVLCV